MTNKISISKEVLSKSYVDEKLSTRAIARIYSCSQGVILRELREHGIKIRPLTEEIYISKKELNDLYINKKLSTYKIAEIYNCDSKTIHRKLRQFGIQTRPIIKIQIPKEELHHLYHVEKWSLSKIAKKFSCCVDPVFDRMREYEIPSRTMSEAKTIYPKQDFSGDLTEKSYLIGFRLGDLNVFKEYHLISVQTNTTISEQLELLKLIFDKYGKSNINKDKNGAFHYGIRLNKSFEFLLPKKDIIEDWILKNDNCFIAFLAGYTDAEGNIQIHKNRLRIRIRSCDKNLLYLAHQKLNEMGIRSMYRLELLAGVYEHKKLNKDFWCLSINRQEDIIKLTKLILPHLKHMKKRKNLILLEMEGKSLPNKYL